MRVDADPEVARHLMATADLIRSAGGYVAPDFTVHCDGADFWCSVAEQPGVADRVLLDYPRELTVPMDQLEWSADPDRADPIGGWSALDSTQRALLEHWTALVALTGKIAQVQQRVPAHAVADPELRGLLTEAGYPELASPPMPNGARDTLISWHSMNAKAPGQQAPRWRLIPLRHFVNHHPDGAPQTPVGASVRLLTSSSSGPEQTFENYGELDALRLLMLFGYVDDSARLVHSIPVTVDGGALGQVRVTSRPPRGIARADVADVPVITRSETGLDLAHLDFRPGNRGRLRQLLALPYRTTGLNERSAASAADDLLTELITANVVFYERLTVATLNQEPVNVPAVSEPSRAKAVHSMLAAVANLQRDHLTSWSP